MGNGCSPRLVWFASTLLGLAWSTSVPAQTQCPFEKFTLSEGVAEGCCVGDDFGWSVDTDGASVAIGWPGTRVVIATLDADIRYDVVIQPEDPDSSAEFGHAVAIDGDRVVVGAPRDDEAATDAGAVYVFDRIDGNWSQTIKLIQSTSSFAGFGSSVDLEGDRLVVGARQDNGFIGAGHVFELIDGVWTHVETLISADAEANGVGYSIALSGDRVVVGAWAAYDTAGAAYVFEYDGLVWSEEATLLSSDLADGDRLGRSVAIDGDVALVGASSADTPQGSNSGAVYVFERETRGWIEQAKLVGSSASQTDYLGYSVDLDGDLAVLSGPSATPVGSGVAFAFERTPGTGSWHEIARLSGDEDLGDKYGFTIALAGRIAIVGAPEEQEIHAGAIYAFELLDDCDGTVVDFCDGDCNRNGVPDPCDITSGVLADCNENLIADVCEYDIAYAHDDGEAEAAYWADNPGDPHDDIMLAGFTVEPGRETIGGIAISWWSWVTPASMEYPATVMVYVDPTGDGDPSDAELVSATEFELATTGNGEFMVIPIDPVFVGEAGDPFFVGARVTESFDQVEFFAPMVVDQSSDAGTSWVALATLGNGDIEDLTNNDVVPIGLLSAVCPSCAGNWMMRALPVEDVSCCLADIDGDGVVGVDDLLTVIASWGDVGGAADINDDGIVDVDDLIGVLAGWGRC